MKNIILFAMLLIMSAASFSQQTEPSPVLTKQGYLQKSKNQKTAGIVIASGGGLLASIGIIVWSGGFSAGLDFSNPDPNAGASERSTGNVLVITGGVVVLGSIPLFIASARNKRKGMSLSFKNETAPQIQNSSFVYKTVPSINLKINL